MKTSGIFGTALVALVLLLPSTAWTQQNLWSTTAVSPQGLDVVEVQKQGAFCNLTNWGFNNLVDATTGIWWDDARGPLDFLPRSVLGPQGQAYVDVYTMTAAPPYNYVTAFQLAVLNAVPNSITVQIPTGIVVVAQPAVPGVSPATVGYYSPPNYNLLMTHVCNQGPPGNQIVSFDHITGDCQGNLYAIGWDGAQNPVLTCLPDPRVMGSCPCPGTIAVLPVIPPPGSSWNNEYVTCDRLGGVWMAGSYGAVGRVDGEVWCYNAGLGVFTKYIPPPGETGGGRFILPADPDPAPSSPNCDEVDVFVAEQSTAPAPTTARLYRLRFTVATLGIGKVGDFRYGQPPVYDALGTINVETAPGVSFGNVWLTVADLTNGRVLFDNFLPMLGAGSQLCGLNVPAASFAPWARGVGCPYSKLVCPRCP